MPFRSSFEEARRVEPPEPVRPPVARVPACARALGNRSLAALLQRDPVLPKPPVTNFQPAASLSAYNDLVVALEHDYPLASPREILTLLRTVYYGKPWSVTPTTQWKDVLPGARPVSDPRPVTGTGPGSLYDALFRSQVVDGTDVGHVLTGLEAMVEARPAVTLAGPANLPIVVEMSNVEFATWGGDVGSVAAMRMADQLTDADMKEPKEYFAKYASTSDLEGDVDAYAIKEQVGGDVKFALQRSFAVTSPSSVSYLLGRFFLTQGPGSVPAREHKYSHFITQIGGTLAHGKITNRMKLLERIAPRVQNFAEIFTLNEVRRRQGSMGAATQVLLTMTGDDEWLDILEEYSWDALDEFLDWLEVRAAAE